LATVCAAQGQPAGGRFSFNLDREPVASLDGQWRFHPGDDPHWSAPDLDDSGWTLIRTGQSWYTQGFPHLDGFAWYRATIQLPDPPQDLSLLVPYVVTSYQVFANGQLLGGVGAMPPRKHPIGQFRVWAVYHLPAATLHTHTLMLAIRVWHSPAWQDFIGGEIDNGLRLGATPLIEQRKQTERIRYLWSYGSTYCLALIAFLAACGSLGFWRKQRSEKEYAWFAAAQFLYAVLAVLNVSQRGMVVDVGEFDFVTALLTGAWGWTTVCFFRHLLGGRRDWWFKAVLGSCLAYPLLALIELLPLFMRSGGLTISISLGNEMSYVLAAIPPLWVVGLLLRRAVQGRSDARLLLAPVLLETLAQLADNLHWVFLFVVGHEPAAYNLFYSFWQWPFPVSMPDVCDLYFFAGMLGVFVYRFVRTGRLEDAHQRELEAARTVQQVLIPHETPMVPGFAVETVYRPAGVVGGDFFQVLPLAGGALAVVGDVSGKGMPAAMTVALLVGTVRTLAHYTTKPGEILSAMNRRMLGRSDGGFTTCLVLHASADGELTAASAGHLSPYINGREVEITSGLPLGLGPDDSYPETRLRLEMDAQLTLITDGVVEARNTRGELFGFARATELSARPAEVIAEAAREFGQEDDITVITLRRVASPTPASGSIAAALAGSSGEKPRGFSMRKTLPSGKRETGNAASR
jgi:hypothetical protein